MAVARGTAPAGGRGVATGCRGRRRGQQFAPVGPRAGHLLAVNLAAFGGVQLFKLLVERLPVGADAFVVGFRSYLTGSVTP
jgi:hypothetical protein